MLISGQYLLGHFAINVGQAKFPARISIGQLLVIQTEQVENGGMQVMKMHTVLDRLDSMLVRSPMVTYERVL